jgi:dUTP pyrophosphatase
LVIDNSFAGDGDEWKMPVLATRDVTIIKGTRVCQFRILKTQPSILFNEVLSLDNPDRNGFGSTGV